MLSSSSPVVPLTIANAAQPVPVLHCSRIARSQCADRDLRPVRRSFDPTRYRELTAAVRRL
jgi:hypothetical protein